MTLVIMSSLKQRSFQVRLSLFRTSVLVFLSIMLMAASCGEQKPNPGGNTTLNNPGDFQAVLVGETQVDLSWAAVSDATGYSLERKIEGGSFTLLKELAKTATSYSDTTVKAGKTYSYLIKTVRDGKKSSGLEAPSKVSVPLPGQPFNLTDLEPVWLSKQVRNDPRSGLPSFEETALNAVTESGTSLTFTGSAEALYSLGGLCTKFSASVNSASKVFVDNVELWSGTGATGNLSLIGKQQLSLISTANATWSTPVVTCSAKPANPDSSYVGGKWGSRFDWGTSPSNKLIATHAANLPDGRIVSWSAWHPLTFGTNADERHDYSEGFVFNPKTNSFAEADNSGGGSLAQNLGHDMFCAGLAMATDGRVIGVGGGTEDSLQKVSFFNFRNSSWEKGPDIARDRWYPTAVALSDGRTFTTLGDDSRDTSEILSANHSSWQLMGSDGSFSTLKPNQSNIEIGNFATQEGWEFNEVDEWYPYLHVAPDGSLFQSGPIPRFNKINTTSGAITPLSTSVPNAQMRTWGNSVMFDEGKILVTGGSVVRGFDATKTGMVIDLSGGNVSAKAIPDMRFKRSFQNSVVLPTGEVLIIGGNTTGKQMVDGSNGLPGANAAYAPYPEAGESPSNAKKRWDSDKPTETVYTPELYSPGKNTWRDMNDMDTPRNYHSVALLLEDGRVLAAGGGLCNCVNNHPDGQIYEPSYLFNPDGSKATRPGIASLSVSNVEGYPRLGYGQQFTVTTSDNSPISKFTMVKLSAVTHGINTDLRYVEYSESKDEDKNVNQFEKLSANSYRLTTTSNPDVLTPGYYFLFAINDKGVPSVAKVVQIL
jgi:Domain of unknown function (DUF1929)